MDPLTPDTPLVEPPSPEDLLPVSLGWEWWSAIGVGILVLTLLAVFIWRNMRPKPISARELQEQAKREAIAALATCATTTLRETATECSIILRRLLAKLTGDPALYETHEEWVSRHDAMESMTEATREQVHQHFCRLAGWKYSPDHGSDDPKEIVEKSRGLVETLSKEVIS